MTNLNENFPNAIGAISNRIYNTIWNSINEDIIDIVSKDIAIDIYDIAWNNISTNIRL